QPLNAVRWDIGNAKALSEVCGYSPEANRAVRLSARDAKRTRAFSKNELADDHFTGRRCRRFAPPDALFLQPPFVARAFGTEIIAIETLPAVGQNMHADHVGLLVTILASDPEE